MSRFDQHDFVGLAKSLAMSKPGDGWDEAKYRTAVGRAYFATFLLARTVAKSKGAPISSNGNAHREVPAYFETRTDDASKKVALSLKTLKRARTQCDYDDAPPVNANIARLQCSMAETAIRIIDAL